ncbi:MAG: hypothetical protein QOE11_1798 [Solirubrobacteraceae bacterium]|nr:hypothetical protein [Solirubrobacteraceae bacterium]
MSCGADAQGRSPLIHTAFAAPSKTSTVGSSIAPAAKGTPYGAPVTKP